jgi:ribonuclease P protein component
MREEDVSAEQSQAEEEARLPGPHAHPRRARVVDAPPGEGPPPSVSLIWRVRDRATFRALAAGRRHRRGVLTVTCVALDAPRDPPRVAYAVGRHVGGAVTRNRVRRRLRSLIAAQRAQLRPGHAYLVGARKGAATAPYAELESTLRVLLDASREVGT